jgi:CheY-like chemotaxis protein
VTSIAGVKILVVEDNVLNQRIVSLILNKMGAVCTTAANGAEAIEKITAADYDIVLMDLNMPIMDGYETANHMRNKMGLKTPIIALTADTFQTDDHHYKKDGINALLTKPFDFDEFTTLVHTLITTRSDHA